jgi:thiamine-phosphate pyrophosphorylase
MPARPDKAAHSPESEPAKCRLYLVSPPRFETKIFARALEQALGAGDVASFQLRMKDAPEAEIVAAARVLMPICHGHDVAFIVNDDPAIAVKLGADGVHVGQQDAGYGEARRMVGRDAIVGVTCHDSRDLALEAAEDGADYVAFGAFFPTGTKEAKSQADPEILRWWSSVTTVPCVAIGGITADNCAPLVEAGADFLAVVSGVWNHPDGPGAGAAAFNIAIRRSLARRQ